MRAVARRAAVIALLSALALVALGPLAGAHIRQPPPCDVPSFL